METIKGVAEHVEVDFGESVVSRDEAISALTQTKGLGPPDLCWLQKSPKGKPTHDIHNNRGYYHWTLGRDVSSSAAIAAYFAHLSSMVEPVGFLQGFWYTTEYEIRRGFYCVYDPFTRCDIRCELCVPGGVVCGVVDGEGQVHDVTPHMWRNVQVASFLRGELFEPELVANVGCVVRKQQPYTSTYEEQVLSYVKELYQDCILPAALDQIGYDPGLGCSALHMDMVLYTVYKYFARVQRWDKVHTYFGGLAPIQPGALAYVAAAHRNNGNRDAALVTLSSALEETPFNEQLLVALAEEFCQRDQVEAAMKLARRAIRVHHRLRPAWLVLARCYVKVNSLALALVTLNVIPTPPLPREDLELVHVVLPPACKTITKPQVLGYDPEVEMARKCAAEEALLEGDRVLAYLPGAVLLHRDPIERGAFPEVAPSRMTKAVLGCVYSVMQQIVDRVGWDNFLEIRSQVFLMHQENATSRVPTSSPRAPPNYQDTSHSPGTLANGAPGVMTENSDTQVSPGPPLGEEGFPERRTSESIPTSVGPTTPLLSSGPSGMITAEGVIANQRVPSGRPHQQVPTHRQPARPPSSLSKVSGPSANPKTPRSYYAQLIHRNQAQEGPKGRTQQPTSQPPAMANGPAGKITSKMPDTQVAASSQVPSDPQQSLSTAPSESSSAAKGTRLLVIPQAKEGATDVRSRSQPESSEIFDLSSLALSETSLGALGPHPHHQGVAPELWSTIFGGPSTLPRIKTGRQPLAEGVDPRRGTDLNNWGHLSGCDIDGGCDGPGAVHEDILSSWQRRVGAARMSRGGRSGTCLSKWSHHATGAWDRSGLPRGPGDHSLKQYRLCRNIGEACFQQMEAVPCPKAPRSWRWHGSAGAPIGEASEVGGPEALSGQQSPTTNPQSTVHRSGNTSPSPWQSPLVGSPYGYDQATHLKSFEADREAAIMGLPLDGRGKRLCVRWLDELIISLWHDLQSFMEWRYVDEEYMATKGVTLAGHVLGLKPQRSFGGGSADHPEPRAVHLTGLDWYRRGFLEERLGHPDSAAMCYRASLKAGTLVSPLAALLRLLGENEDVRKLVQVLQKLMAWHENKQPYVKYKVPPLEVVIAIAKIFSGRNEQPVLELFPPDVHPALVDALAVVTRWQADDLREHQSSGP